MCRGRSLQKDLPKRELHSGSEFQSWPPCLPDHTWQPESVTVCPLTLLSPWGKGLDYVFAKRHLPRFVFYYTHCSLAIPDNRRSLTTVCLVTSKYKAITRTAARTDANKATPLSSFEKEKPSRKYCASPASFILHMETRRELFKKLKMDVQSNVRLFNSVLSDVCSVHKIGAITDLQQFCLKLPTQDKKDVLACLPTGPVMSSKANV